MHIVFQLFTLCLDMVTLCSGCLHCIKIVHILFRLVHVVFQLFTLCSGCIHCVLVVYIVFWLFLLSSDFFILCSYCSHCIQTCWLDARRSDLCSLSHEHCRDLISAWHMRREADIRYWLCNIGRINIVWDSEGKGKYCVEDWFRQHVCEQVYFCLYFTF